MEPPFCMRSSFCTVQSFAKRTKNKIYVPVWIISIFKLYIDLKKDGRQT